MVILTRYSNKQCSKLTPAVGCSYRLYYNITEWWVRCPEQAGRTVVAGRLVPISGGLCEMWMRFGLDWSCLIY
jgi:hypothetical protein